MTKNIEDIKAFQDYRFLAHICEILHHLEFYDLERNFCGRGLHNGKLSLTREQVEEYENEIREWYHQLYDKLEVAKSDEEKP